MDYDLQIAGQNSPFLLLEWYGVVCLPYIPLRDCSSQLLCCLSCQTVTWKEDPKRLILLCLQAREKESLKRCCQVGALQCPEGHGNNVESTHLLFLLPLLLVVQKDTRLQSTYESVRWVRSPRRPFKKRYHYLSHSRHDIRHDKRKQNNTAKAVHSLIKTHHIIWSAHIWLYTTVRSVWSYLVYLSV